MLGKGQDRRKLIQINPKIEDLCNQVTMVVIVEDKTD